MIDTVTLFINNAGHYGYLDFFDRPGSGETHFSIPSGDFENVKSKSVDGVFYNATGETFLFNKLDKLYNPSSNYYIGIKPNRQADRIEVEFSIPKYFFGHNIGQWLNYDDIKTRATFQHLVKGLKRFFDEKFSVIPDWRDVEIRRLDICYNQFFENKKDCLEYLEGVKPLFSRLARKNGRQPVPFEHGYQFVTRRMSFKVYHKGSEFRKNDIKRISEMKLIRYTASQLADIADKCLRYEATFRGSYFNYLFNYLYVTSVVSTPLVRSSVYRRLFYHQRIGEGGNNSSRSFAFASEYDSMGFLPSGVYIGENYLPPDLARYKKMLFPQQVTFDLVLYDRMEKAFWSMVKKVQPTTTSGDWRLFLERVKDFNSKRNAGAIFHSKRPPQISEKRALLWFKMSQKPGGLKVCVQKGFMSQRTYYYVLKLFRYMGLSDYNPNRVFVHPGLGFGMYKELFSYLH